MQVILNTIADKAVNPQPGAPKFIAINRVVERVVAVCKHEKDVLFTRSFDAATPVGEILNWARNPQQHEDFAVSIVLEVVISPDLAEIKKEPVA
jgi:hypothetical protein